MPQIIPPSPTDAPFGSYNWADWYEKVRRAINNATNTIPATQGGTGLTSYGVGDTLYASATTTLSKLAIGANGKVLTVVAGVPAWATPTGAAPLNTSVIGTNAGDVTIAATAAFTDAGSYTATLAASAGQTLEWTFTASVYSTSAAVWSIVLGVAINGTDLGAQSTNLTFLTTATSQAYVVSFKGRRVVVAGDISGGNVTVKLRAKGDGVRVCKLLDSGGINPIFTLTNLG